MEDIVIWKNQILQQHFKQLEQQILFSYLHKNGVYGKFLHLGIAEWSGMEKFSKLSDIIYLNDDINERASLHSSYEELPFQDASIRTILLPHILEYEPDPKRILQECYRVLIAQGTVIILLFNPLSLFGIKKYCSFSKKYPFCGPWLDPLKFFRIVRSLKFTLKSVDSYFFRPPVNSKILLNCLLPLERFGCLLPSVGGSLMLVLQKKVVPLSPTSLKLVSKKPNLNRNIDAVE